MKRICRVLSSSGRGERLAARVLVHARMVTDPKKLAQLRGEAARQKRRAEAISRSTIEKSMPRGGFRAI
jgi:hypothetical protein